MSIIHFNEQALEDMTPDAYRLHVLGATYPLLRGHVRTYVAVLKQALAC